MLAPPATPVYRAFPRYGCGEYSRYWPPYVRGCFVGHQHLTHMPIRIFDPSNKSLAPLQPASEYLLVDKSTPGVRADSPIGRVSKATLDSYVKNFSDHFRINGSSSSPIDVDSYIRWKDVSDMVSAANITSMPRAVVVYFGLDGSTIRYAFRVIGMDPDHVPVPGDDFGYDPWIEAGSSGELPTHLLDPGTKSLITTPSELIKWGGYRSAYFANVNVDSNASAAYEPLGEKPLANPKAVVFPWEKEIFALYTDNEKVASGPLFLRVRSTACLSYDAGSEGFRHGVTFCMSDDNGDMLDPGRSAVVTRLTPDIDAPNADSYKGLAADIGHRCPPKCKSYKVPTIP